MISLSQDARPRCCVSLPWRQQVAEQVAETGLSQTARPRRCVVLPWWQRVATMSLSQDARPRSRISLPWRQQGVKAAKILSDILMLLLLLNYITCISIPLTTLMHDGHTCCRATWTSTS